MLLVRVQLSGADPSDYEVLHDRMQRAGFARSVKGPDGTEFDLPHAQYLIADADVRRVTTAARRAVERLGLRGQVVVSAGPLSWYGLERSVSIESRLIQFIRQATPRHARKLVLWKTPRREQAEECSSYSGWRHDDLSEWSPETIAADVREIAESRSHLPISSSSLLYDPDEADPDDGLFRVDAHDEAGKVVHSFAFSVMPEEVALDPVAATEGAE